jgi:hypothetical protein
MIQEFDPLFWERLSAEYDGNYLSYSAFAKKKAETEALKEELKEEIRRLKTALEEAKSQVGRFHGSAPMHPAVDALLNQAKVLSALIFERDGITTR